MASFGGAAAADAAQTSPPPTSLENLPLPSIDNNYRPGLVTASAVCGSILAHFLLYTAARLAAKRTRYVFDTELVANLKWPTFFLFPTVALKVALRTFRIIQHSSVNALMQQLCMITILLEAAWMAVKCVRVGMSSLLRQNDWAKSPDNWKQRKAVTQIAVLKRLCYIFIAFGAFSGIVFTFPGAWQVGMSLLASAGAAGLVLGLAAKPGLENIIASLTIAFTQPITLDDEIIIGGEYGRVEEIRSQYVVVRTWDGRRLINPLSSFTTSSFENWSKTSPWKIGTVFFYFDPLILGNLADLRARLESILTTTDGGRRLWDGKVMCLQVTDVKQTGVVEVRTLTSARCPGDNFDLRCLVRELLMAYVVEKFPGALCRTRAEIRVFNDASCTWNRGGKAKIRSLETMASSTDIDKALEQAEVAVA